MHYCVTLMSLTLRYEEQLSDRGCDQAEFGTHSMCADTDKLSLMTRITGCFIVSVVTDFSWLHGLSMSEIMSIHVLFFTSVNGAMNVGTATCLTHIMTKHLYGRH